MTPRTHLRAAFHAGLDAILAVSLAPTCAGCSAPLSSPLEGPVCAPCWASLRPPTPPICRICGDSLPSWRVVCAGMERCARCRRARPAIDTGRAAAAYEGPLRGIIHAFKYEGRRSLARRLGAMLCEAGLELFADADCVVPIPLHPWRQFRRGFNQADDLAATLPLPVVRALWRSRATPPQAGLAAATRRRNVRGAFRLSPFLFPHRAERYVSGRIIILVDDVRTTGATLDACARILKDAGAREVRALTVAAARVPADRSTRMI